jgi:hypothetical protein
LRLPGEKLGLGLVERRRLMNFCAQLPAAFALRLRWSEGFRLAHPAHAFASA